jgi:hypothetical protein
MQIISHEINTIKIAEILAEEILIHDPEDALQLMMDLYYQDFNILILHEKNITPDFFDLKTGLAGEVLQKFSNYKMQLFLVGNFTKYPGQSINDFIYESNQGKQVSFVDSTEQALEKMNR